MSRIERWWAGLEPEVQRQWHGVALCISLFLVHYSFLSGWYVEDAAISFSYARHLAEGEGLVAWPGGERVQGYSNPTWTLLLALAHALGLGPWTAAKLFGAAFGAATLPLAYLWARRLTGARGLLPVVAPFFLAVSPQHVIWAASGLENSLVGFCAAAAALGVWSQARTGRWPSAGLLLAVLALSRPDAPLYAAVIGAGGIAVAVRERGWAGIRWAGGLAAVALLPFAIFQLGSWWYFAWPLPNTYYAKIGDSGRFEPLGWGIRGWSYLREWALQTTWGFYLPLAGVVMAGLRGARAQAAGFIAWTTALLLLAGADWVQGPTGLVEPELVVQLRVGWLGLLGLGLPLLGLGRRGDVERAVAWGLLVAALFFALYSGGDWMKGHRWLATAQVPLAVLLADGIGTLTGAAERRVARWTRELGAHGLGARLGLGGSGLGVRAVIAGLLLSPLVVGHVAYQVQNLQAVETSPFLVYKRVRYMHRAQERLGLDHVVHAEIDFGAQMWWTGHELVDLAGLNDVPIAQRRWERPFIEEYLFDEKRPDFVHSHGGWARRTGLARSGTFQREYIEIPGYPQNERWLHVGNHVRKDLFVEKAWGEPVARFEGVELRLRALDEAASGALHLEHGLSLTAPSPQPFRVLAALVAGEARVVWELPPGYDWYPPDRWAIDEVIIGRHVLPIPDTLPPGSYDLVFVVLDDRGVLPGEPLVSGAVAPPRAIAALAAGEVRFPQAIRLVSDEEGAQRVEAALKRARAQAQDGKCEEAEQAVREARRSVDPARSRPERRPEIVASLARCWAQVALERAEPADQVEAIRTARRWDHRNPGVRAAGRRLAETFQARGEEARAQGALDQAHEEWTRALIAEPSRSWLRRRVEGLRAERLGLSGEGR